VTLYQATDLIVQQDATFSISCAIFNTPVSTTQCVEFNGIGPTQWLFTEFPNAIAAQTTIVTAFANTLANPTDHPYVLSIAV
jgi:hypothetical protein